MQHLRRALLSPSARRFLVLSFQNVPRGALFATREVATASFSRRFSSAVDGQPSSTRDEQGSLNKGTINRLMYRARQRGWLELDLLVGMWAEREIHHLSPQGLRDLENLLDQENPELYKWLTGQIPAPDYMAKNQAFQAIRSEVKAAMDEHGAPTALAKEGTQWLNAWVDYKKQLEEAGAKLGGEVKDKP